MPNKRSNLVNVGRLSGAFGVKGWIKVKSFTEPKENIVSYSPWWLKTKHGVKPYEVAEYNQRNDGLVVRFNGIDDRDQAALLNLVDVAVERTQMPTLGDGEYYWHQLQGLNVNASHNGRAYYLGVVKELMETGANDVLVISPNDDSIDDRERLVPYVPIVYVTSVDIDAGSISVLWDPEF